MDYESLFCQACVGLNGGGGTKKSQYAHGLMMQGQMVGCPVAGCSKLVLSGKSFVLINTALVIGCDD